MKRVIALVLLLGLLMSPFCYATEMPATDKVAHFGVGYIINDQLVRHTKLTFIERMTVITGVAYIKERHDTYIDGKDILATVEGGLFYQIKF